MAKKVTETKKQAPEQSDAYILDVPGLPVYQFSKKGVKAMTKKTFMDIYVKRIGENYAKQVYESINGSK